MSGRRFEVLTKGTMTAEQRRIADEIASGPRRENFALLQQPGDDVLKGPFNAMLRSPELAEPAHRLGEAVRFRSTLPKPLTELAILLTARKWTAQFEWYAHERIGRE